MLITPAKEPMGALTEALGLTGPESYVDAVAISPDGTLLAAGSDDKRVWLWDITDPAHPRPLPTLNGPDSYVYGVASSRDGARLAGAHRRRCGVGLGRA